MHEFDSQLAMELRNQGWSPERQVPIGHWLQPLVDEGFSELAISNAILSNFGGLQLAPKYSAERVWSPESFQFDPVAAASGEFDRVDDIQKRYRIKFFPVADYGSGMLLISERGQLVGLFDDLLLCFGEQFPEALTCLIFANRMWTLWGEAYQNYGWKVPSDVANRLGITPDP